MQIYVDQEGAEALDNLIDMALKGAGKFALSAVNQVVGRVQLIKPEPKEEPKPEAEKVQDTAPEEEPILVGEEVAPDVATLATPKYINTRVKI